MATKTWTGGSGSYATDSNWSDGKAPLAGDTGIFAAGTLKIGAIDIAASTALLVGNGDYTTELHVELTGTSLAGVVHTGALGGNGDAEAYDIGGTVTLAGTISGAQAYGLMDFNDLAAPATLLVASSGVISSISADLNLNVSTIENDGIITTVNAYEYVASQTITGTGTFVLTTQPKGDIPNTNTVSFAHGVASGVTVAFTGGGEAELVLADPGDFAATISGFNAACDIQLNSTQADAATFNKGVLTVTNGGVTVAKLNLAGTYPDSFKVDHVGRYGEAESFDSFIRLVACFASGTRIATTRGAVAVENLHVGDIALTVGAAPSAPIVWLGHRRIDPGRHPRPQDVMPVRVCANAFGPEQPRCDLFLSPDHAVFVRGVLIPVRYLVNGRTIVQEPRDTVTYWHVELDRHGVLQAEGLPCESYLDTGNRAAFANGGGAIQLHADFAMCVWQARACAMLVRDGEALRAARSSLLQRANLLGHATTTDPDLRVLASGRVLRPTVTGTRHRFHLPAGTGIVRPTSRSAIPAESREDSGDHRRLGVAVSGLSLDGQAIQLDDPRLISGWHDVEFDGAAPLWRWTDGDAALTAGGARTVDIEVAITERYWSRARAA